MNPLRLMRPAEKAAIEVLGTPRQSLSCVEASANDDSIIHFLGSERQRLFFETEMRALWRSKWDGGWEYSARDGRFYDPDGFEVLAYSVAPEKVLVFAKGKFGHTVHRFPES